MGRTIKMARAPADDANTPTSSTNSSSPRIKYRNLRYGCRLCPNQQFSQLSSGTQRNRQSAVEGHINANHPEHADNWRGIAYKWGHRVYYDNSTTADVHNPRELGEEKRPRKLRQKKAVLTQAAASGYQYADGQLVESSQSNVTAGYPTPQSVFTAYSDGRSPVEANEDIEGQYAKGEDDTITDVGEDDPEGQTPGSAVARFRQQYNSAEDEEPQPPTEFAPELLLNSANFTAQREPGPIGMNTQVQQVQQGRSSLVVSPQGPCGDNSQSQPNTNTLPPALAYSQPAPSRQQHHHRTQQSQHPSLAPRSQPQTQSQSHQQQSFLSPFDMDITQGEFGPQMATMAYRLFYGPPFHEDPDMAVQMRKETAFVYLRESRKLLLLQNTELRRMVQGYGM